MQLCLDLCQQTRFLCFLCYSYSNPLLYIMYATGSAFQTLPFHVVLAIVDHVLTTIPAYNIGLTSPASLALLHTCQSIRIAYFKRSCETLVLSLGKSIKPQLYHPKCLYGVTPSIYQTSHWARHVSVQAKSWNCIANTSVISWMHKSENLLHFPLAHTLSVTVGDCQYKCTLNHSEISKAIEYIDQFLQLTKKMVPSTSYIKVKLGKVPLAKTCHEDNMAMSHAITNLLKDSSGVEMDIDTRSQVSIILSPSDLARLVRIKYMVRGDSHPWLPELVRRNSGSLKSLTIIGITSHTARLLIHCENVAVAYPLLETFELFKVQPLIAATETTFSGTEHSLCQTTHFPVLKKLYVTDLYPFACNILSLGCNQILEYLHIPVSLNADWPDIQLPSFGNAQFINLKTLVLQSIRSAAGSQTDRDMYASIAPYAYSLLRYSSDLACFKYNGFIGPSRLENMISESAMHTMCTLSIGHITLSLSQIVQILRGAPRLSSLLCALGGIDPVFDGMSPSDVCKYMCANLCPLSASLNEIDITANFGIPTKLILQLCAFLAIGCPRLTKFKYWPMQKGELRAMVKEFAPKEPYSAYSEQLEFFSSKLL